MNEYRLPLPDALIEWSTPDAVKAIRDAEWSAGNLTLSSTARFTLDSIRNGRTVPFNWRLSSGGIAGISHLSEAWDSLISRFKLEVERETIGLEGTEDFITRSRTTILPDQAAEIVVDPPSGAIFIGMKTYKGVIAFRPTLNESVAKAPTTDFQGARPTSTTGPITSATSIGSVQNIDVTKLHPDFVAALLEQHAEHVRTALRVSLAPPGKASAIALMASMMKHRSEQGLLRPTLAEEANWLAAWVATAAPSYFLPGVKVVKNKLAGLYRDLTQGGPKQQGNRP